MLTTKNTAGLVASQPGQESKRMKIKILRGTVVNGEAVTEGQVVETSEADAAYLINLGKAIAIGEPVIETADAPEPVAVETTAKRPARKTRKP